MQRAKKSFQDIHTYLSSIDPSDLSLVLGIALIGLGCNELWGRAVAALVVGSVMVVLPVMGVLVQALRKEK